MKLLLLILLLPLTALAQPDLIIRHINIIDVKTGNIKSNEYVSIHNRKIIAIHADNKSLKFSEKQIDGTGKYLIPGLWDMHTHAGADNVAFKKNFVIPSMLANGVTGMRIMFGTTHDLQLRDSVNKGLLVAPRMVVGSPLLDGPTAIFPWSLIIANVERVPVVVDSLWQMGYDFMKVYSFLRSDLFFALAKYCNQKHIPFAGHVPVGVTAEEASNAGQRSFEHLFGLLKSYAANDKELAKQWEKEADTAQGTLSRLNILVACEYSELPVDSVKAKRVAAVLRKNKTYIVPTLTALRGVSYGPDSLKHLPELSYADPGHLESWQTRYVTMPQNAVATTLHNLSFLHQQGVKILAGTDNENPYTIHGFTLHEELEWYQQAGLSPLEALQTATLNPVIFLHKENELGSVDIGKFADLVILNGNPLTDISNTKKIDAVIMFGALIDKAQIEQMLSKLKQKAAR